jgi:hypothetical protein
MPGNEPSDCLIDSRSSLLVGDGKVHKRKTRVQHLGRDQPDELMGDVTLAPPQTRAELDEDLRVLGTTGPLGDEEYAALAEHGERVRRNAGGFR